MTRHVFEFISDLSEQLFYTLRSLVADDGPNLAPLALFPRKFVFLS